MSDTQVRPTYHQSGLGSFEFCGHAYLLSRIEGRKGLSNFYLVRGSGCHVARKLNLKQKVKTNKNLTLAVMQDCARDLINKRCDKEQVDFKCPELDGLGKKAARGRIIDTTMPLVKLGRSMFQMTLRPKQVELEQKITLKDWPFDLQFTTDCIDVHNFLTDLKTTKRRWSQDKADEQYQPAVYELGYRGHNFGEPSSGFRFHVLVATSRTHYGYMLDTSRTKEQIVAVLERFAAMDKAIKAGSFVPAHTSSWKCSSQWCDFYRECKYVVRK